MKNIIVIIAFLFFLLSCKQESSIRIIDVSEYGIHANTKENTVAKINELIERLSDEPAIIVFPKGRYDFYPDSNYLKDYYESNTYDINPKRLAIFLHHKKNITIDAQGSDFIYHDHIQPITIDQCENITIKNLNIDWENPLTAEAEVLEADSTHILVSIDSLQFPHHVHDKGITLAADSWEAEWRLSGGSWLIEIDQNHIIPPHTGDHGCVNGNLQEVRYSAVSPSRVLMQGHFTKTPAIGNRLIIRHSSRDHAGIFLFHSTNLKLHNINVYHTSGLGILSQYCENLEFKKVNTIPNPHKNRFLSGHDDGLHFMACKGEIIIDSCSAQGLMDDPINIHGTYVPLTEILSDSSLRCRFAHDMSKGLIWAEKGDTIGFVLKKNMQTKAYAIVSQFKSINEYDFILKFNTALPEDIDTLFSLENMSWTPNVSITHCFAGSNRARGYLISTPGKVLIAHNVFETSGSAILIAGDANYWYESGAVRDITIRDNEFRWPCNSSSYQFCNAIISIYPEIPQLDSLLPYHQNIRIENNSFHTADFPILYAKSVDGLYFNHNDITRSFEYTAWHPNQYNFFINACKNVQILDNQIAQDVLGRNILLKNMSKAELQIKGNTLDIVTE